MLLIDPEEPVKPKLPIGIQTFREIREAPCYYVDKTGYIGRLVTEGKHYFLSRPRRFGKSLFLDTLKELFAGNEPLFTGLAIHPRWDWSVRHPVLRLDFSRGNFKELGELQEDAMAQLAAMEKRAGVGSDCAGAPARFSHLLEALHERTGQRVVVLIDEYDKPILDALEVPEVARANRDFLRGLYATIKDCDAHIAFSFLTGVSKFSKVSLFSGLNNLIDITLEPALLSDLRLYRGGLGRGVRRGTARVGPRRNPYVVQRVQLAGGGTGVQPLRCPPAARPPPVRCLLV